MVNSEKYNLGEILIGFSDAMDLASPHMAMHQQRTAYISWYVASAAGLSEETIDRIFVAAILHDIGALTAEEKLSLFLSESKTPENHCVLGELLFNEVPWLRASSTIVRNHHKDWSEYDAASMEESILEAQILMLADTLERAIDRNHYILNQRPGLKSMINSLAGGALHPQVVEYFTAASASEAFWLDLASPNLNNILLELFAEKSIQIDLQGLKSLATLFKSIIDFKSSFTATHSTGVAACASMLCGLFGFTKAEMTLMGIAGDLHDIGKLAVPNRILEKPGKLTDEEFAVMKQHTYHTYAILNKIKGFEQIAKWASFHHEKLDGTGYPFRLDESKIGIGARILAVADVFIALSEDRPYRKAMPKEQLMGIMENMVATRCLDKYVVNNLMQNYEEVVRCVQEYKKSDGRNYMDIYQKYLEVRQA